MAPNDRIIEDNEGPGLSGKASGECPVDLVETSRLQGLNLYPQLLGGGACLLQEDDMTEILRIREDGHTLDARQDIGKQLKAFAAQLRREKTHAGDVAAGPRETGNQPRPDRLSHRNEDDGNRGGRGLRRLTGRGGC
jgi:hypothetical protein